MQRLIFALVALVAVSVASASIENDPVRVTHRNSGPRYDLSAENEVERVPLADREPERPLRPVQSPADQDGPLASGPVIIRRIFLFPTVHSNQDPDDQERPRHDSRLLDNPFLNLLRAPWLMPHAGPRASDSMDSARASERPFPPSMMAERDESSPETPVQPQMDPFRLMLSILRQTIHAAASEEADKSPTSASSEPPKETTKEESTEMDKESSSALEEPQNPFRHLLGLGDVSKPGRTNETKEDIVEIDGKKFARKMVVTKHVGDNMFFVTRRLVFTPLNETTDSTEEKIPTSTGTPLQTTTLVPNKDAASSDIGPEVKVAESSPAPTPSSTTTTTTTTTTPEPTTVAAASSSEAPAPSTPAEELTTTTTSTEASIRVAPKAGAATA